MHKRGYRYVWPPIISKLTPQEAARLQRGYNLLKGNKGARQSDWEGLEEFAEEQGLAI